MGPSGDLTYTVVISCDDLNFPVDMTRGNFADLTTISELIPPSSHSNPQQAVDHIGTWSQKNLLQLNPSKCKEILTFFIRCPAIFAPLEVDRFKFGRLQSAKVARCFTAASQAASGEIKQIQRCTMRIVFPELNYRKALETAITPTLAARHEKVSFNN